MPSFKITLSYDGTDFVGWQRQANGVSIQSLLEDALRALNAHLPGAIRVLVADEAAPTFHPRFCACTKRYRYRIWNGDVISPFERRYAWHLTGTLDLDAMRAAARLVEGRHDFAAFQASGGSATTSQREVFSSRFDCQSPTPNPDSRTPNPESPLLVYEISGSGFLRHMVRTIVGSLVEVGRGRRPAGWIEDLLALRDRTAAGPTAPAMGLFLVSVEYGGALAALS